MFLNVCRYPYLIFSKVSPLNLCFLVFKSMLWCIAWSYFNFTTFWLCFPLLQVLVELYIMVFGMDQYVPCSLALVNFVFYVAVCTQYMNLGYFIWKLVLQCWHPTSWVQGFCIHRLCIGFPGLNVMCNSINWHKWSKCHLMCLTRCHFFSSN